MRLLADVLRHLDRSRFCARMIVLDRFDGVADEFPRDIVVECLFPRGKGRKTNALPVLLKTLRAARRSDIVVSWCDFWLGYLTVVAARLARRPIIAWVQNDIEAILAAGSMSPWLHSALYRTLISSADHVVSISQGLTESLKSCFGIRHVTTILNGVDLDQIGIRSKEPQQKIAEPYLINVAGFSTSKNQSLLLKAHRSLLDKGLRVDVVFCGTGPLLESCKSEAAQLGTLDRCHFLGFQSNPYPLMKNAAAFVLTSRWEPYGLVLAEALSMGIPVVSTDSGSGPREVLAEGAAGLIVPNSDQISLTAAIERVLTDRALNDRLRRQGPLAAAQHDIRCRVVQIEDLFMEAISHRPCATTAGAGGVQL